MNVNVKITIDTLMAKAKRISEYSQYDYKITDIIDLCYEFDYEYAEGKRIELDIYRP